MSSFHQILNSEILKTKIDRDRWILENLPLYKEKCSSPGCLCHTPSDGRYCSQTRYDVYSGLGNEEKRMKEISYASAQNQWKEIRTRESTTEYSGSIQETDIFSVVNTKLNSTELD